MIKCNGCIHFCICSSREVKCKHYESKADICREFAEKVVERYNAEEEYKKDYPLIMTKLLAEMEKEQ